MMAECNSDDLEQYAGEVIKDPWEDPEQDDWKMNPEGGPNGMDSDTDAGESPEPDQHSVPSPE
jgi:hypothetical protein